MSDFKWVDLKEAAAVKLTAGVFARATSATVALSEPWQSQ